MMLRSLPVPPKMPQREVYYELLVSASPPPCMWVYVLYVRGICMSAHTCMWGVHTLVYVWVRQGRQWNVFLYYSLPHSLETGFLTEPETLCAGKAGQPELLGSPVSTPNTWVMGPQGRVSAGDLNSDLHTGTVSLYFWERKWRFWEVKSLNLISCQTD